MLSLRWLSAKESAYQCRRHKRHLFSPWVGKIPCRRKWQPSPVFLPGNYMDRGAWRATVHRVTKSPKQLNTHVIQFNKCGIMIIVETSCVRYLIPEINTILYLVLFIPGYIFIWSMFVLIYT